MVYYGFFVVNDALRFIWSDVPGWVRILEVILVSTFFLIAFRFVIERVGTWHGLEKLTPAQFEARNRVLKELVEVNGRIALEKSLLRRCSWLFFTDARNFDHELLIGNDGCRPVIVSPIPVATHLGYTSLRRNATNPTTEPGFSCEPQPSQFVAVNIPPENVAATSEISDDDYESATSEDGFDENEIFTRDGRVNFGHKRGVTLEGARGGQCKMTSEQEIKQPIEKRMRAKLPVMMTTAMPGRYPNRNARRPVLMKPILSKEKKAEDVDGKKQPPQE